jgi:hypothetical protein
VRRLTRGRAAGQAVVLVALLLPILVGMLALVIDLGVAMAQLRGRQNAADAGVLAGAQLMAASVTQGQGTVAYAHLANQVVHDRVDALVASNRLLDVPTFSYATAVQFHDCGGASLGYTASSDAALVAALGGTHLAAPTTIVPNGTCPLKVHTRVGFPSFFAAVLGYPSQAVGAQAAARIAPTTAPTRVTGIWPLTHWAANATDPCPDETGAICTFWDSNAAPGGSFKETLNLSRYSDLLGAPRIQHWVDYDHAWPGNTGQIPDLEHWLRYGWGGALFVDEADARCRTGAGASLACSNSKLEIYNGNNGNNLAEMMTNYINDPAHLEGTDPVRGRYATVNVAFWRYGEQDIDPATDVGTLWTGPANPNTIQRAILQKVRRYRFYASTVSSSSVRGYFVSFYNGGGTPQDGPPSTVANTVVATE